MKIVSDSNKDRTIPMESKNLIPSLDTSIYLSTVYYYIVEDMNNIHAKTSLFELTKITS